MRNMLPLLAGVTFYLGFLGGIRADAQVGAVLRNSIRHHPAASSPSDAVSASPGVTGNAERHALPSPQCSGDSECRAAEFCSGSRGACLLCRRKRKRCARDGMCCSGNRCINGLCQPADTDTAPRAEGSTDELSRTETHGKNFSHPKRIPIQSRDQQMLKGAEGEMCLRSSDCQEGLCCARHFWSRICKPVLSVGQVCTRHKRKATHGLEIFQRCDCRPGLSCRGQRDRAPEESRNLHTCQTR